MKRLVALVLVLSVVPGFGACDRTAVAARHPYAVTQWRDEALKAGWPYSSLPKLMCIIRYESGGNPRAYNGRDPHGGSRGLTQVNGINTGWLRRAGIIRYASDLYNPVVNLRAARAIYRGHGWRAWTTHSRC